MIRQGSRRQRGTTPGRRRRLTAGSLVVGVALLGAGAALALVALRGPMTPRTMDERVRAVAASLRCPVCQNLTVADSPSRLAQEMRRTIAADLRAGNTEQEIRAEFVGAYGQWILESPPKRGIDLVAWLLPAALVLGGLAAGLIAVSRWRRGGLATRRAAQAVSDPALGLTASDRALLEGALASVEEDPE
jgi:cytochrome c-type biogenesis protein CcmH